MYINATWEREKRNCEQILMKTKLTVHFLIFGALCQQLTLYNTFIFPYLIYCVELWGCAKNALSIPLYFTKEDC